MNTRIQPPTDFPVTWEAPEDPQYHWTRDREHIPEPITPLYEDITAYMFHTARARTLHVYDEAVLTREDRRINTYLYTRLIPFTGTPAALAERRQQHYRKIRPVAMNIGEMWENHWRPEILDIFATWDAFDLRDATWSELVAHFEESVSYGVRLWELHHLFGPPMWFAIDEFVTFYCELFPHASVLEAHQLLQGFDNKTMEMGRALWRVSQLARQSESVLNLLGQELHTLTLLATLAHMPEARPFFQALRAFLDEWGGRSNLWDWGYPSWQDDPTPVLNNIKNYLKQADRDLNAERAAVAHQREQLIAKARIQLAKYPLAVGERFETLLKAAQDALILTENHTFYLDFNGFGRLHRVIREIGTRLNADQRLAHPDHVFQLTLSELRELFANPKLDYRTPAILRRAEMDYWAKQDEPRELGTRPNNAPDLYSPDARRMQKYIGGVLPEDLATKTPNTRPHEIIGQGGSSGCVRGPVRLITSLSEAHRLQPGDVLVTTTTAPPWTPLFLTAAAVVTDAGGLLSHGAVVAREYHLPAVVGTRWATDVLRDGQMVEVDGDAGVVRLL
jgi:pyruvate,water dikinase